MNPEDLQKLLQSVNKKVRIIATEGEQLVMKVLWVDTTNCDVTFDLISTSEPERYAGIGGVNAQRAYLIPFDFISRVEPWKNE